MKTSQVGSRSRGEEDTNEALKGTGRAFRHSVVRSFSSPPRPLTSAFGEGMPMRFRFLSLLIVIAVPVVIVALNLRQSKTVTEPHPGGGAVKHPPPYEMKLMTISVHTDQGWPIWHTRASNHFAAHNAALFLDEGGLHYEQANPQTDYVRAGIDFTIGLLILIVTA